MIEIKSNDSSLSSSFKQFEKNLPDTKKIQLVDGIYRERTYPDGTEIRELSTWLSGLDLKNKQMAT